MSVSPIAPFKNKETLSRARDSEHLLMENYSKILHRVAARRKRNNQSLHMLRRDLDISIEQFSLAFNHVFPNRDARFFRVESQDGTNKSGLKFVSSVGWSDFLSNPASMNGAHKALNGFRIDSESLSREPIICLSQGGIFSYELSTNEYVRRHPDDLPFIAGLQAGSGTIITHAVAVPFAGIAYGIVGNRRSRGEPISELDADGYAFGVFNNLRAHLSRLLDDISPPEWSFSPSARKIFSLPMLVRRAVEIAKEGAYNFPKLSTDTRVTIGKSFAESQLLLEPIVFHELESCLAPLIFEASMHLAHIHISHSTFDAAGKTYEIINLLGRKGEPPLYVGTSSSIAAQRHLASITSTLRGLRGNLIAQMCDTPPGWKYAILLPVGN